MLQTVYWRTSEMFLICNIRDYNYYFQLIVSTSWFFLGGEYNFASV